ncbi:MAG: hypothetical protein C5B55_13790 [Blastocatellia bacterium]|nr:MAG: hypothetical protein C5B55_13790 [Blastocatellia bacterium]
MNFKVCRRLTALSMALVFLLFVCVRPNPAEDTLTPITRWQVLQANPVYVVAPPPDQKIPARPINLPVGTLRKPVPTPAPEEVITELPFPMSAAQAVKIGNGLIQDSDFYQALVYFQEARKLQPPLADALIGVATCYYELHRDDEALATYQSLSESQANVWEVQFNIGRLHLEHGRFAEAVEAFNKALTLKPSDLDTISSLGLAQTKAGRHAEAISNLTQVTAARRYTAQDFFSLGEAYANSGEWLKAAEAFKSGAERGIDPDDYSNWAKMLYNGDKLQEALEAFKKVKNSFDLENKHVESYYYMADLYKRFNDPVQALSHYRQVLRLKPNDIDSLVQAAYLCFKLGQLGDAERYYRELSLVDPTNAANSNLAAIQCRDNEKKRDTGQPTPGVTLRELAKANPNHGESQLNLGAQLITEGIYPEALTTLQQAVKLLPESAAAHFDLGLVQLYLGDFQAAVASNQRALLLNPQWSDAYNDLGRAYAGLKKWNEATQAYLDAIRITPNYAGAIYNLGVSYLELGRKDLASQYSERLKGLDKVGLQARLANMIGGVDPSNPRASLADTPVSAPTQTTTISTTSSPAVTVDSSETSATVSTTPEKASEETSGASQKPVQELGCPSPFYVPSDVIQMATIQSEIPTFFTDEALKNNAQGRVVLQAVLCGTGRVANVTVEKSLPYGLTERAIEILKLINFTPAQLNGKPVSVLFKQEFVCEQSICRALR